MPLTDVAIKTFKLTEGSAKLADGGGMYLLINSAGRYWRMDYRHDGKRKTLALGVYPEIGLKAARVKREQARALLKAGVDPSAQRKAEKSSSSGANSFETIAREWFARFAPGWAPSHSDKIIQRLERDIFPWLGNRPIHTVTAPDLLTVLRRIEERGAVETAHRAKQNCGQVFRYAVATGRADHDPAAALRGALPPAKEGHFPAITEPDSLGSLLRAIDAYPGHVVVRTSLKLLPLVFVRPGELRQAEWSEINLDLAEWLIPAERMKMKQPHVVPLSTQAVAILRDLHPLTGGGRYVFPGARNQNIAMSNMAASVALKAMGFGGEMTAHGFRAVARTLLDEVLGFRPEVIEHQLAHAVKDPLGRAYNRTSHIAERRRMMQSWADYLDGLKAGGAEVIQFPTPSKRTAQGG